jgi:endonuclease/exonuclease/phosphatase (EEP) superfamily protein YafD
VLVGVLLGLAGTMAASLTPVFDILTPMTGHLLGFGAAALLALRASRGRIALLALGATVTLLVHTAIGWSRQAASVEHIDDAHNDGRFRVLTVNAWHAHRDPDRLIRFLVAERATIVVLAEFGPDKAPLLRSLESLYPYRSSCADHWHCSLVVLSRVPIETAGHTLAAAYRPPIVWARVRPFPLQPAVTVVGTHVHRPTRNPMRSAAHIDQLVAALRRIEGPFILAGDLNAPANSAAIEMLMSGTGLAAADCWVPTWPGWPLNLPQFAFDHVLTSSELSIVRLSLGPPVGSDHLPVRADITFGKTTSARCG